MMVVMGILAIPCGITDLGSIKATPDYIREQNMTSFLISKINVFPFSFPKFKS
ncbi:MAG: hypothetical protein RBG13Loki_2581 [Promethearchaeota archaeon CR_4]|nr:MAG: hypothetical protein RBG13Loki_2581 [Candidatus Lokiarchaeota archaeon CR_4]